MEEKTTLEKFISYVKTTIDDKGVYPHPGWIMGNDDKLTVMSIALPPGDVYHTMFKTAKKQDTKELIFAIDRYNKEGQDIDICFASVLTIVYFNTQQKKVEVVALPYNSPEDIGEPQYQNKWWLAAVADEMKQYFERDICKN